MLHWKFILVSDTTYFKNVYSIYIIIMQSLNNYLWNIAIVKSKMAAQNTIFHVYLNFYGTKQVFF